jgi:hypothetical protein
MPVISWSSPIGAESAIVMRQLKSLGVQLAVEHFDPLLQLLDPGEQLLPFIVERSHALPHGAHNGVL